MDLPEPWQLLKLLPVYEEPRTVEVCYGQGDDALVRVSNPLGHLPLAVERGPRRRLLVHLKIQELLAQEAERTLPHVRGALQVLRQGLAQDLVIHGERQRRAQKVLPLHLDHVQSEGADLQSPLDPMSRGLRRAGADLAVEEVLQDCRTNRAGHGRAVLRYGEANPWPLVPSLRDGGEGELLRRGRRPPRKEMRDQRAAGRAVHHQHRVLGVFARDRENERAHLRRNRHFGLCIPEGFPPYGWELHLLCRTFPGRRHPRSDLEETVFTLPRDGCRVPEVPVVLLRSHLVSMELADASDLGAEREVPSEILPQLCLLGAPKRWENALVAQHQADLRLAYDVGVYCQLDVKRGAATHFDEPAPLQAAPAEGRQSTTVEAAIPGDHELHIVPGDAFC
mmetsp:Transcript_38999/g.121535  ORF Transcript_38999/g.121535 Transcript_38999/m.121535 type:complete len:394 (+) Transcript_38999:529-1710(+)